ncbi:hypothetical protein [Streptomyces sp. NPDC006668]|uniref:hypothetical protein n=1 Tax=Streptomyces sp. NPDC006668 TaxID=3156903 RepID=UPI0033C92A46
MTATAFRFGAECSYPLAHAGPDPRFTESLIDPVTAVPVGYGCSLFAARQDWAALESALSSFLYNPQGSEI